ncbi:hypothetical protein QTP88_019588 [Uroleucon formosanum]
MEFQLILKLVLIDITLEINMTSKKRSPFYVFLSSHRRDEINEGNKAPSLKELAIQLSPKWNTLADDEKDKYVVLANEYNSTLVKKQPLKHISDPQKNNDDFWNMQKYLTKMFECIPNNEELFKKKFILFHINCHTLDEEQYYFPAEIAALEFNLIDGISHTFHCVIGISKIYPRGFAGGMRQFSNQFHQILCFEDDYQQMLLEFSIFLKDGIINHADLQEGISDLPYLFTIESEISTNLMKTKNSLKRLYSTAYQKDISYVCSKAHIIQWMSNFFKYICANTGLHLKPGRHTAVQLRNGSKLIIENAHLPLSKEDLNIKRKLRAKKNAKSGFDMVIMYINFLFAINIYPTYSILLNPTSCPTHVKGTLFNIPFKKHNFTI